MKAITEDQRARLFDGWTTVVRYKLSLEHAMYVSGSAEHQFGLMVRELLGDEGGITISPEGVARFEDGTTLDLRAEVKGEGVSVQEQAVPALSKDDGSVAGG